MVYKYKNNKKDVDFTCCPFGYISDFGTVECNHFGIVTKDYCSKCDVRKNNDIITKNIMELDD